MASRILKSLLRIVLGVVLGGVLIVLGALIYLAQPSFRSNSRSDVRVDREALKAHVITLSERFHPRNFKEIANLNATADYIRGHLEKAGAETSFQSFEVARQPYQNVVSVFGRGLAETSSPWWGAHGIGAGPSRSRSG